MFNNIIVKCWINCLTKLTNNTLSIILTPYDQLNIFKITSAATVSATLFPFFQHHLGPSPHHLGPSYSFNTIWDLLSLSAPSGTFPFFEHHLSETFSVFPHHLGPSQSFCTIWDLLSLSAPSGSFPVFQEYLGPSQSFSTIWNLPNLLTPSETSVFQHHLGPSQSFSELFTYAIIYNNLKVILQ